MNSSPYPSQTAANTGSSSTVPQLAVSLRIRCLHIPCTQSSDPSLCHRRTSRLQFLQDIVCHLWLPLIKLRHLDFFCSKEVRQRFCGFVRLLAQQLTVYLTAHNKHKICQVFDTLNCHHYTQLCAQFIGMISLLPALQIQLVIIMFIVHCRKTCRLLLLLILFFLNFKPQGVKIPRAKNKS